MATLLAETSFSRAAQPRVGDVIAERYQIEEPIGQGGYGQVFRARHLGTGQDVAIKVLIPQGGDETFTIKRFFLEARVTSGLKHPNTIKVFDFGQEDSGLVYLAMELLAGCTLREDLRARRKEQRPFTEKEAVELAIAVTRSLGEAHAAGLVHRDLKPDNIFLHRAGEDDEPTIKVLDFGIVKLGDGQHTLSSTTSVPGTPAYMSPEHALNQNVDGRADLYSLGVILYQMVTLELPFRGESDPQTLYMHAFQPVPDVATHARTPISDDLARNISIVLSKRPDDRFRDAREMRDALRACLDPSFAPSRPSRRLAPTSQTLDGAPMNTPHADSYLMPPNTRPSRRWERWTLIAGLAGLTFSVGAVVVALKGEHAPRIEAAALPPPIPVVLDAGVVEAAPDAAVIAEPPVPRPIKKAGAKKKPKSKRKIAAPPEPPPPAEEKEAEKDLLHMRLEDLVEPK